MSLMLLFAGKGKAGPSVLPPVADFIGSPLSGNAPLEVAFVDTSTGGPPTSWLWEKNDGSGWTTFSTSQNPTEELDYGTWSIRLTVSNTAGSDTKTRTDYIDSIWTPVVLPGLAPSIQVALSLLQGKLWQDVAKTVPATEDGDPVRVATCPWTGEDYVAPSDSARPLLWEEGGGKWSLIFDGIDDQFTMPNGTIGNPASGGIWINSSNVTSGIRFIASHSAGIEIGIINTNPYKNISFIFGDIGTSSGFDSAVVISNSAFYSVVVSYAGGNVSTPGNYSSYLNGSSQIVVASGPFGGGAVGTFGTRGSFYFSGRVPGYTPTSSTISPTNASLLSTYLATL